MKRPRSLQTRLALALGALLTAIWIGAASVAAAMVSHAIDEVFDAALQETAQRILPLAVADILGRDDEGRSQRLGEIRGHEELLTYIVRDERGRTLLLSHDADPAIFPPWDGVGYGASASHRFYSEAAVQGTIRLTVAEPLAHRAAVARDIQIGLGLPWLFALPLALAAIGWVIRSSLTPLRRFRQRLATRSERDMSRLPDDGLPAEVRPVLDSINDLLRRLTAAFEAERSFAAHAAHELRTPLAGAMAQAQRLQAETQDPVARARAADMETTLKRLTRLAERLLQLARAEGGRLRRDHASDVRPVIQLLMHDLARPVDAQRVQLRLPQTALMSDLDPDVLAIIVHNLVEIALRHGAADAPVMVHLSRDGWLTVSNDGPVIPPQTLARLTQRFERAGQPGEGSGLGLAIVQAIADRLGSRLVLSSPRPGQRTGFEATLQILIDPTDGFPSPPEPLG